MQEARKRLEQAYRAEALPPEVQTVEVELTEALGRVIAQPVVSADDVPGFDRTTVDGFAVRARDTFGASESLPAYLKIVEEVIMGQAASFTLKEAQAARIATGGMLPPGADAVVMVENTECPDDKTVALGRPVAPGENIVRRGEDVAGGFPVLEAGQRLGPADISFLAACGIPRVPVRPLARVGIIATGDELVAPGGETTPGKVRDSNSYGLYALVRQAGGEPSLYGIVPDDLETLVQRLGRALEENDLVLVSGGSSVGTRDLTVAALEYFGDPGLLFHGLALRPGKPTLAKAANSKLIFGLPGHPASALVIFELLIAPLVTYGSYNLLPGANRVVPAKIGRSLASGPGREDFIRVRLELRRGELWAEPLLGKSGLLRTLVGADGLVRIALAQEGVVKGETVLVELY